MSKIVILLVGLVIAAFAAVVIWAIHTDDQWDAACHAKGGHVVSMYKSAVCVTQDGRIIDGE